MAKKIIKKIKVVFPAGKATPAPPNGPILGQAGVPIGPFMSQFNADTKDMQGMVPVTITVYEDRSYETKYGIAPASDLLMRAAGVEKGSGKNLTAKAGTVTQMQLREIAEIKMPDLNANDVEAAMQIIAGTARSMGIEVKK